MQEVGYAVTIKPLLASYRLRVAIPAPHLGMPYVIGRTGNPTFFYKLGNPAIARECNGPVVFDVVNDHFSRFPSVGEMAALADRLTVGSAAMAETVRRHTRRDSTVIDDPYENDESKPACMGGEVLWYGHTVNLSSLKAIYGRLKGVKLTVCTNAEHANVVYWTPSSERRCLERAAVVLLTGTNPGASSNRVVKALRAGRFVVVPENCAESWRQFAPYIWVGDVREGIEWAKNNREDVCQKIAAGQDYIRQKFSPQSIGSQWAALFGSI